MLRDVYQKPFLSYTEQIALLKSRGLFFKDEEKALRIFERVSYYRLSNYWYSFLKEKQNKIFKENTCFDIVFKLYKFDKDLRKIIMSEIEKIEIAVRSKMAHILSLASGNFWLEKKDLFSNSKIHATIMSNIDRFAMGFPADWQEEPLWK